MGIGNQQGGYLIKLYTLKKEGGYPTERRSKKRHFDLQKAEAQHVSLGSSALVLCLGLGCGGVNVVA